MRLTRVVTKYPMHSLPSQELTTLAHPYSMVPVKEETDKILFSAPWRDKAHSRSVSSYCTTDLGVPAAAESGERSAEKVSSTSF